jgi:hypothetical protein
MPRKAPSTLLLLLVQICTLSLPPGSLVCLGHPVADGSAGDDDAAGSPDRVASWLSDRGAELGNVKAVTVPTGPKGWVQAEHGVRVERNIEAGEVIMTGMHKW